MDDYITKSHSVDLGKNTFLEKWPDWLRWSLFLPASAIVPALIAVIYLIFNTWLLDLGKDAFYFNLLRGIIYGAGFVWVGSVVAPKKQKIVALFLLIIVAMLSGIALLYEFNNFILNNVLETLITLVAAGYATFYIFKEIDI